MDGVYIGFKLSNYFYRMGMDLKVSENDFGEKDIF